MLTAVSGSTTLRRPLRRSCSRSPRCAEHSRLVLRCAIGLAPRIRTIGVVVSHEPDHQSRGERRRTATTAAGFSVAATRRVPASCARTSRTARSTNGQRIVSCTCTKWCRLGSYLPVWQPGALIYASGSQAVQGNGEISLTALETPMQEVLVEVVLHKQTNFQ